MPPLAVFGCGLFLLTTCAYLAQRLRTATRELQGFKKMIAKLELDFADRRAIERELAHMASFADMAPNPILEMNPDGSLGYKNAAAEQTFPTLAKRGIEHPLFEGVGTAVEMLKRNGHALLTRPIKIDERVYDQQITLLDGGPRVRLYLSDITKLKRLDQLKSDFVNMVSHELRTPLTSISASIKMIAGGVMGAVNSDQTDALHLAQVNVDRLARMINDLLDVSKIEAGKLELHRARIDIATLIKEVCKSFEPLAKERGLQIRSKLTPTHIETLVDPDKILQVFVNLMNNALKFTEKGYVEVSAEGHEGEVRCQVSDTGMGIAPENLPKIFNKFQQVGPTPKGREKGTGLGLSLCKGFVELHGGTIWVESRPREGTQFVFVLPQLKVEDIFTEHARAALSDTVAAEKPLSFLRLEIKEWPALRAKSSREGVSRAAQELQELIRTVLGIDADSILHDEGTFWAILPATGRTVAEDIVQRFRDSWRQSPLVKKIGLSPEIGVRRISVPEDGSVLEELISLLAAA